MAAVAWVVRPHSHRLSPKINSLAISGEQLLLIKRWSRSFSAVQTFECTMGATREQALTRFTAQPIPLGPGFNMVDRKLIELTFLVQVIITAFDAEGHELAVEFGVIDVQMSNV